MSQVLYKDKLIRISDHSITFYNYYFPTSKSLTVLLEDVEKVNTIKPTIFNGKYRFWGTSNLFTWFPKDLKRNLRDKIFILYRKNKKIKIGFTAENSQKVFEVLLELQLF